MRRSLISTALCALLLASPGTALAQSAPARPAEEPCAMTAREVLDEFIPLFFEQRNAKLAFERWVHPDYKNHNPFAATGRDAAVNFLQPFFDANPQARYIVHRVIADGDLVAVHNEARFNLEGPPSAVVDIFRVENCKIVEHWDVVQQVPERSMNDNGMF
jgi:predicted SnoaL-like aldol condensation-catalyzing enzyme